MLVILITILSVAIPLQSLTSTHWVRIGFISLIFTCFLAITNNISSNYMEVTSSSLETLTLYNDLLKSSSITSSIDILILITSAFLFSPIFAYKNGGEIRRGENLIFGLCTILGSVILLGSNDLLIFLLGIELQSYSVYLMASQYKNLEPSVAAGLKYYLLGALASALILLGIGLLYAVTGSTNIQFISSLLLSNEGYQSNNYGQILGMILIFLGLIWKFGGAPLHYWSVDVYDAVPTLSASWLAIIPKIALLSIMGDLFCCISSTSEINNLLSSFTYNIGPLTSLILFVCALSLIIGAIAALTQPLIKRVLTYSTVAQLGFILLAMINLPYQGHSAFIFYLIQYTLTNAGIWLCLIAIPILHSNLSFLSINKGFTETSVPNSKFSYKINKEYEEIRSIKELQGLSLSGVFISLSFSIFLFSLAGIPPFIGFFAKFEVISSAISGGFLLTSLIAILSSLVSAVYYLKIIRSIWFTKSFGNLVYSNSKYRNYLDLFFLYSKEKKIKENKKKEEDRNIFPIWALALNISIITATVSLFILQDFVCLTWCYLISL